jgi:hypothetical protein
MYSTCCTDNTGVLARLHSTLVNSHLTYVTFVLRVEIPSGLVTRRSTLPSLLLDAKVWLSACTGILLDRENQEFDTTIRIRLALMPKR